MPDVHIIFQWRLARGEAGQNQGIQEGNSFTLTSKEIEAKCIHLEYDCSNDQYSRPVDGSTLDGWQEGVYERDNHEEGGNINNWIMRKEEHDSKMVYLARTQSVMSDLIGGVYLILALFDDKALQCFP